MGWEREAEFRELLRRVARRPTRDALDDLALSAVDGADAGYKHASALLLRQLRAARPERRLAAFYALSAVVRASAATLGAEDRYTARLAPHLDAVGALLAAAPARDRARAARELVAWRREGCFSEAAVARLRAAVEAGGGPAASEAGPSPPAPVDAGRPRSSAEQAALGLPDEAPAPERPPTEVLINEALG
jgi:hypothetical protein